MKVLLIQPPIRDFYNTPVRTQPIGLAYIAASLREHGHEVDILDCRSDKKHEAPIPSELAYLKAWYPFHDHSPYALYRGYYHCGMSWDDIRRAVEDADADVWGISSGFTPYHGEALEVAGIIKRWNPGTIVVMGGAHVSADPEGVLQNPLVDYAVMGEGERSLPLLLRELEKKGRAPVEINGVGYRTDGAITVRTPHQFIENLDTLPYPARDLLNPESYRIGRKRLTMLITSRGCPHRCAYCSAHHTMGSGFRMRSIAPIIDEMKECHELHDIQIFDIEDDNFTYDQRRAKDLLRQIAETFGEQKIEMAAMNGVSFASLDAELLMLMKCAGFKTINLSLVSTDDCLKSTMGRPQGVSDFSALLNQAERAGLNVVAYAILGMPGQNLAEMVETIGYLMGKRVLMGPSIYYPSPGTALFETCRREGILPPCASQWRSSAFPIETANFTRLDLLTLFRLVRAVNFIKAKMDEKTIPEGISIKDLCRLLREKMIGDDPGSFPPGSRGHRSEDTRHDMSWQGLIVRLLTERAFFCLQKASDGGIIATRVAQSQKVIDYFLEKLWFKPIAGSRAPAENKADR